jgi:hypothetical protein
LEGRWNYIYFCYKRFADHPRAISYVYFSGSKTIKALTFADIKHFIFKNYAIFRLGSKEFVYEPFNG